MFVMTKALSQQAYFCCDKRCVLSLQTRVCCDKTFVRKTVKQNANFNGKIKNKINSGQAPSSKLAFVALKRRLPCALKMCTFRFGSLK